MRTLGVLKRLDAREVWERERDFTGWLRENISLLGAALGMDLDLAEAEVPVGPFAADLVAKDVSSDRLVVIENQLEPTDHSHLGQLLTYGAGKEAAILVWISPEFRDEHRAALDWLNQRTDQDSSFFGVAIELVAVDDSAPAPNFKLLSFPNEWRKEARKPEAVSGLSSAYECFFGELLSTFKARYPGETYASKPSTANWQSLSIGRTGFYNSWTFTAGRRFRIELYIDIGNKDANKSLFDQLAEHRVQIEEAIGHDLEWDRLEGRNACRISTYYPSPIAVTDGDETLRPLIEWAAEEMIRFRRAVRHLVAELRMPATSATISDQH